MFEVCSVKDNWARRAGEITKCVQSQDLDSWFKTKCLYPCIRSSFLLLFCLDMLSCLEVSRDALYSYVQVATLAFFGGSQPRDFPCLCKGQASNITCRWWNAPVESWAGALAVRPGHVGPAEKQPIQPAVWHATSVLFRHVPWFSCKKPVFPSFSIIFHYREASKACFCRHDMTEAAACEVPLASSHHLLPKSCGSAYTASVSVDGLRAFILTRQTGLWHAVAYFRNMVNLVLLLFSRDMYGGMIHNNYYINHHPIAPFAIYDIR